MNPRDIAGERKKKQKNKKKNNCNSNFYSDTVDGGMWQCGWLLVQLFEAVGAAVSFHSVAQLVVEASLVVESVLHPVGDLQRLEQGHHCRHHAHSSQQGWNRTRPFVVVACWLFLHNIPVCLRDGRAQTIVCAATLTKKLQITCYLTQSQYSNTRPTSPFNARVVITRVVITRVVITRVLIFSPWRDLKGESGGTVPLFVTVEIPGH